MANSIIYTIHRFGKGEWHVWEYGGRLYHSPVTQPGEWQEADWRSAPDSFEMKKKNGKRFFRPSTAITIQREGPPPGWTLEEIEKEVDLQNKQQNQMAEWAEYTNTIKGPQSQ